MLVLEASVTMKIYLQMYKFAATRLFRQNYLAETFLCSLVAYSYIYYSL